MKQIIAITIMFFAAAFLVNAEDQPENKPVQKHFLYQWTDSKGVLHITDGLGKIPERYRDRARKMESVKGPEPEEGRPAIDHTADDEARQADAQAEAEAKAEWRYRMQEWKQKLANAEKEQRALQQERDSIALTWGAVEKAPDGARLRAAEIDRQLKAVQDEIDTARNMLNSVLPDEARKAGVPPGWLRD